ncbi:hypothetical protein ABT065_14330 [Streptomyces sp. NPDC002764]|uniref:hypothetical protein n=1 Tax=Streptomyces sp. NPDC002764 TaxID=3154428 RepID=UPI00331BDC47
MDPAVISAIAAAPTTLVASAAAYAAGRLQARGAHRGPVDAVRRQHQRDAYAAYLSALNAYAYATEWGECLARARLRLAEIEGGASSEHFYPGYADPQARQVRADAGELLAPLRPALDVVSLEGPEHVAKLADQVCGTAYAVHYASNAATVLGPVREPGPDELHSRLLVEIAAFTEAARDYLNG